MASFVATATNNMPYLGYGFLGGMLGTYIQERWSGSANASIVGGYEIESGVAGLLADYIFLVAGNPDTSSVVKGMLVGWAGAFIFNKFLRGVYNTATATAMSEL